MKKKLIISSYDDLKNPYFAGGGALAVHEIAKRLVKKNYNITILTGKYPGCKNEIIDGVTYERIGTSFLGAQLDQVTFQLFLPFFVLTKKFDIWMESFTPPFSTAFLQLFSKKPIIGLVHMLSGEDMKRKYKLPFHLVENLGIKTYRYIITTSEIVKEKIKKQNPKATIAVIPNGIEKIPTEKSHTQGQYILFLGRIEVNQKGLDLLLKAYAKIVEAQSFVPLYIAGSGEKKELDTVHSLIANLSVTKQVKLLGRVTGKEKEKLYQEASFVVLPSRFETFSIVALEAMSYRKALIYADIDGLQWIPKNAGIAVKPFDEIQLAEEMVKLVNNNKEAEQMGRNGQNYAKNFTWDIIVEKYIILLSSWLVQDPGDFRIPDKPE